ncbi:MAG: carbon monoxide dehydrogenase subunit G [Bacteroidetes bacterium]|nr:carbon monoxide dehydrogenase subunit G [Bacteroidota bacterium]MDA1121354.1 carbon monoxide dehydrogenase subunit G [Bacteroidota bacterium]
MIVQGRYRILASATDVWIHLMDPEVLKKVTPGISELMPLGDDKYKATSKIKIGPVNGSFEGQLELIEKIENKTATIVVNQTSKIGNVSAEIKMHLEAIENTTEIVYQGEAKLSGKLAMMGQRIIGGVITSLSKQFFESLNKEIINS